MEHERAFALIKYQADRAHELEVDKVNGQYEVAFVQGLFILNGGSAVAFITLLASNLNNVVLKAGLWVAIALVTWLIGLVLAMVTALLVYKAQSGFARSLRARRHALALEIYGRNVASVLGLSSNDDITSLAATGEERQTLADHRFEVANVIGVISAGCFVIGAVLASAAVAMAR